MKGKHQTETVYAEGPSVISKVPGSEKGAQKIVKDGEL